MSKLTIFGIWAFIVGGLLSLGLSAWRILKNWRTSIGSVITLSLVLISIIGGFAIFKNAFSEGADAVQS